MKESEKTSRLNKKLIILTTLVFFSLLLIVIGSTLIYYYDLFNLFPKEDEDSLLFTIRINGIYAFNDSVVQSISVDAYDIFYLETSTGFYVQAILKPFYVVWTNNINLWVNSTVYYMNCSLYEANELTLFEDLQSSNTLTIYHEQTYYDLIIEVYVDLLNVDSTLSDTQEGTKA